MAFGDPGAVLPGVQVKMPLSLLTVPGLGRRVLSSPSPRATYRQILGVGEADGESVSALPKCGRGRVTRVVVKPITVVCGTAACVGPRSG